MSTARMTYGSYEFDPIPLLTYNVEQTYDDQDQILFRTITYSLNGTLLATSGGGDFGVLMGYRQTLEDALTVQNQQFVIYSDNIPQTSGYPIVENVIFEEGTWVDRLSYSADLVVKDTSVGSGNIESYSESWAYNEDENRKTISVEHSLSAQGINTAGSGVNNALSNAKTYVTDRMGYPNAPSFMPAFTEGSGTLTAYGSIRTENADISDGTYEATETFILSSGAYIHTSSTTFNRDAENVVTIDVEGEITGLGRSLDAYNNARIGWGEVNPGLFNTASGVYQYYGGNRNLVDSSISFSVAENSQNGLISYSASYEDSETLLPSGIKSFVMNKEINEPVGVYATHLIVEKADGNVVQNLNTSTEGSVRLTGTVVKESDYPLSSLKTFINSKIVAETPSSYATTYRMTDKTYSIDDTGNTVEFSATFVFTAPAYSTNLTYLLE